MNENIPYRTKSARPVRGMLKLRNQLLGHIDYTNKKLRCQQFYKENEKVFRQQDF